MRSRSVEFIMVTTYFLAVILFHLMKLEPVKSSSTFAHQQLTYYLIRILFLVNIPDTVVDLLYVVRDRCFDSCNSSEHIRGLASAGFPLY